MRKDISFSNMITYTNQKRVGKPWIPNLSATPFCSVASTLARESGGSFLDKTSAAALYSGASCLQ